MKEQKTDFHKIVILSLGTGAPDASGRLEVGHGEWGIADWLWQDCWWEKPLVVALKHSEGIKHTVLFQETKA